MALSPPQIRNLANLIKLHQLRITLLPTTTSLRIQRRRRSRAPSLHLSSPNGLILPKADLIPTNHLAVEIQTPVMNNSPVRLKPFIKSLLCAKYPCLQPGFFEDPTGDSPESKITALFYP